MRPLAYALGLALTAVTLSSAAAVAQGGATAVGVKQVELRVLAETVPVFAEVTTARDGAVASRVAGNVQEVHVLAGMRVAEGDLLVELFPALRDGEPPLRFTARKDDRSFGDTQRLAFELVRIINVRFVVLMITAHIERPIPQTAAWERLLPFTAYLPVKPAVWFQKTLVAKHTEERNFAAGLHFSRRNHRGQDVF